MFMTGLFPNTTWTKIQVGFEKTKRLFYTLIKKIEPNVW